MKALVTGGAGFIGSQLAGELCARGHEVRVLDNFATGHRANLAALPADLELVEGDIQSYERVHNAVRGCEVVFHQAALPSVPRSVQDPLTSNAANVIGTLNVLLAARDSGVRRVVFASSSSVYGATETLPKREDLPAVPISPYAVAKLAGEGYCRSFSQVYGLETVALRYFNVFGPRQDPLSQYAAVIPNFITACSTAARRRSSATASSRATSPTSTTSCGRTCSPARRRESQGRPSTSPPESGSRSTIWSRRCARPPAARSRRSTSRRDPATSGIRSPTSPGRGRRWATSPRPT